MTAINLLIDHDCSYLVTDTGHFTPSGKIAILGTKTLVLAAVPMAIAFTGKHRPEWLVEELDRLIMMARVDTILAALPEALRRVCSRLGEQPEAGEITTNLFVASFDRETGQPGAHVILSAPLESHPDWRPFTVIDADPGMMVPAVNVLSIMPEGYFTDIRRDGWKILQAQRRHRFPQYRGCGVAGVGELYVIGAHGVTAEAIGIFPEQPGQRPRADKHGRPLTDTPMIIA